jgi:nitrogen-specific signal transduction histidine kinase
MTREVMDRAFEPFFTTKEPGKGTGLGLASAFGTARQAGRTILLDSVPGEGSTFTSLLPAAGDAPATFTGGQPPETSTGTVALRSIQSATTTASRR